MLQMSAADAGRRRETMNIEQHVAKQIERNSPYPFLLVFVREFLEGAILDGHRVEDSIPFCSEADARGWVDAINTKAERGRVRGKVDYRVIEHTIVRIPRAPLEDMWDGVAWDAL
jgi:hypothetical protein